MCSDLLQILEAGCQLVSQSENLIRDPVCVRQAASHSFYSPVSTNNDVKHSSFLLPILIHVSCQECHPEVIQKLKVGQKAPGLHLVTGGLPDLPDQPLTSCGTAHLCLSASSWPPRRAKAFTLQPAPYLTLGTSASVEDT